MKNNDPYKLNAKFVLFKNTDDNDEKVGVFYKNDGQLHTDEYGKFAKRIDIFTF